MYPADQRRCGTTHDIVRRSFLIPQDASVRGLCEALQSALQPCHDDMICSPQASSMSTSHYFFACFAEVPCLRALYYHTAGSTWALQWLPVRACQHKKPSRKLGASHVPTREQAVGLAGLAQVTNEHGLMSAPQSPCCNIRLYTFGVEA